MNVAQCLIAKKRGPRALGPVANIRKPAALGGEDAAGVE
jgi:hypothetical protein